MHTPGTLDKPSMAGAPSTSGVHVPELFDVELTVKRVSYGVGARELKDRPNVLRAVLGEAAHGAAGARGEPG